MLTWLPTFFKESYDLPVDKAGGMAAVFVMLVGSGMVGCGFFADRISLSDPTRKWTAGVAFCSIAFVALMIAFRLPTGTAQLGATRHRPEAAAPRRDHHSDRGREPARHPPRHSVGIGDRPDSRTGRRRFLTPIVRSPTGYTEAPHPAQDSRGTLPPVKQRRPDRHRWHISIGDRYCAVVLPTAGVRLPIVRRPHRRISPRPVRLLTPMVSRRGLRLPRGRRGRRRRCASTRRRARAPVR